MRGNLQSGTGGIISHKGIVSGGNTYVAYLDLIAAYINTIRWLTILGDGQIIGASKIQHIASFKGFTINKASVGKVILADTSLTIIGFAYVRRGQGHLDFLWLYNQGAILVGNDVIVQGMIPRLQF